MVDYSIPDLVGQTVDLPTIPEVIVDLNAAVEDRTVGLQQAADVLARDADLAAAIVRMVNSPFFGVQRRVAELTTAMSVMGLHRVRRTAMNAALIAIVRESERESPFFEPERFWEHALLTAVAARAIGAVSRKLDDVDPEDAFTVGLWHDVGRALLFASVEQDYEEVLARAAASGEPRIEAETARFDFNHADVGSVLAMQWLLPHDLAAAIRYHHAPDRDPFPGPLSALVHLADHLASSAGVPSTPGVIAPVVVADVCRRVGVEPDAVSDLLPQIREDFELLRALA